VEKAVFSSRNIRGQKNRPLRGGTSPPRLRLSPSPLDGEGASRQRRACPERSRRGVRYPKASRWDFGGSLGLDGINRINWIGINPVHPVILSRILESGLSPQIRRLSFQDVDPSADGLCDMETSKCRRLYFPPGIYVGRKNRLLQGGPHRLATHPLR